MTDWLVAALTAAIEIVEQDADNVHRIDCSNWERDWECTCRHSETILRRCAADRKIVGLCTPDSYDDPTWGDPYTECWRDAIRALAEGYGLDP